MGTPSGQEFSKRKGRRQDQFLSGRRTSFPSSPFQGPYLPRLATLQPEARHSDSYKEENGFHISRTNAKRRPGLWRFSLSFHSMDDARTGIRAYKASPGLRREHFPPTK